MCLLCKLFQSGLQIMREDCYNIMNNVDFRIVILYLMQNFNSCNKKAKHWVGYSSPHLRQVGDLNASFRIKFWSPLNVFQHSLGSASLSARFSGILIGLDLVWVEVKWLQMGFRSFLLFLGLFLDLRCCWMRIEFSKKRVIAM